MSKSQPASWTMKPLTNLQRQRITLNLFVGVALLAVGSVASATFLPYVHSQPSYSYLANTKTSFFSYRCPAYDNSERAAFLEQQRKLKEERGEIEVLVRKRRKAKAKALVEQNTTNEEQKQ